MNFLPDLLEATQEATDAATKMVFLQRDLFLADVKAKTHDHAWRTVWNIATILAVQVGVILGFFWIGYALHGRGWTPVEIGLLSLSTSGLIAALCAWISLRSTHGWNR